MEGMDKFDYGKALEELEEIARKVEDPATGLDETDALVRRSTSLIEACRAYLRGVRESMDKVPDKD